jgi:hypothetical protein
MSGQGSSYQVSHIRDSSGSIRFLQPKLQKDDTKSTTTSMRPPHYVQDNTDTQTAWAPLIGCLKSESATALRLPMADERNAP